MQTKSQNSTAKETVKSVESNGESTTEERKLSKHISPSSDQDGNFAYVALVGPPNAGKSTLMNQLIGQKIAITSRKPQTTRHRILGIKTTETEQVVFVDTPGIHDPGNKTLNKVINKTAINSLEGVDLVVFMMDDRGWDEETERAFSKLGNPSVPVFLIINKIDKLKDKAKLLPLLANSQQRFKFKEIIPLSARNQRDTNLLWKQVVKVLPKDGGGFGFPVDQITDKGQRFMAAEFVREQIFRQLGQELPYSSAVEVNQFEQEKDDLLAMDMTIWVDRKGQKGIIVGKNGEKLKEIGKRARLQMENLFGVKVYLTLWVKVRSGWADNAGMLKSLGYSEG